MRYHLMTCSQFLISFSNCYVAVHDGIGDQSRDQRRHDRGGNFPPPILASDRYCRYMCLNENAIVCVNYTVFWVINHWTEACVLHGQSYHCRVYCFRNEIDEFSKNCHRFWPWKSGPDLIRGGSSA